MDITDDDRSAVGAIVQDVRNWIGEGRPVSVWLVSGQVLQGVTGIAFDNWTVTIDHNALKWRFRLDQIAGASHK